MATVVETRYRPEDLLAITDRPMPELVDGGLVERDMGQESDAIAATVLILVGGYVKAHDLGLVNGAQGSYQIFPDDPDKVRIPDVSFTRKERLYPEGPAKGHSRIVPDLVVEVISPNDTASSLNAKIEDYLRARVRLIWVVDPGNRTVTIWHDDRLGLSLQSSDTLDGGDIVPGFSCPVATLFG